MKSIVIFLNLTLAFCYGRENRVGRLFSLFNVVSFRNEICGDSNGDSGVCVTSAECREINGGHATVNCAAGFGVCCVTTLADCQATVESNLTYVTNPEFPDAYTKSTPCSIRIKQMEDTCFIRLDFARFSVRNANLSPGDGDCDLDALTTTSATKQNPPVICGENAGQHMYIDAGYYGNKNDIYIKQTFTGTTFNRYWKIRVSYIECHSDSRPHSQDCVMYFTGLSGNVKTYNYHQTTESEYFHLNNQNYRICVRTESGFCSIRWTPANDNISFKITGQAPGANAASTMGRAGSSKYK